MGDSSRTVLLGEEADEEPSGAFISGSDEAIDPPMLSSKNTGGVLLAGWADTDMDNTPGMLLCHGTVPPWAVRERAKVILTDGQGSNFFTAA